MNVGESALRPQRPCNLLDRATPPDSRPRRGWDRQKVSALGVSRRRCASVVVRNRPPACDSATRS